MRELLVHLAALTALVAGVVRLWPHLQACPGAACVAGTLLAVALATFAAWLALLLVDYLLHHARLVAVPAVAGVVAMAVLHPSFSIGVGAAIVLLARSGASDD